MIVTTILFCRKSIMLLRSNSWNSEECAEKQAAGTTATCTCDAAIDDEGHGAEQYIDPSVDDVGARGIT